MTKGGPLYDSYHIIKQVNIIYAFLPNDIYIK